MDIYYCNATDEGSACTPSTLFLDNGSLLDSGSHFLGALYGMSANDNPGDQIKVEVVVNTITRRAMDIYSN